MAEISHKHAIVEITITMGTDAESGGPMVLFNGVKVVPTAIPDAPESIKELGPHSCIVLALRAIEATHQNQADQENVSMIQLAHG